jgi:hypothetical protein
LRQNILSGVDNRANLYAGGKNLRQNTVPGVGSMANLFTGGKELEAEYFAWILQHVSQTDQTFMKEGKNWRQNILPHVGSISSRLIKPLNSNCRTGGRISCLASAAWLQNLSNLYAGGEK